VESGRLRGRRKPGFTCTYKHCSFNDFRDTMTRPVLSDKFFISPFQMQTHPRIPIYHLCPHLLFRWSRSELVLALVRAIVLLVIMIVGSLQGACYCFVLLHECLRCWIDHVAVKGSGTMNPCTIERMKQRSRYLIFGSLYFM